MMPTRRIWPRLSRFIPLIFIGTLLAQPNEGVGNESAAETNSLKQLSLEELMQVRVVTATAVDSDPFELPFMTAVRTRRDYERMLPRTLSQWLQDVPGVMIQKTAYGQQSPYLRGLTGFRTLFLIDGIRLNNSTFREGPNQYWSTVDPLSVNQLEVVKGPSSVLYGSDSIGGTVNALTLGPQSFGPEPDAGGLALYRYSSAEDSHTVRGEASGNLNEKLGVFAGGTFKSFGDFTAGPALGERPHTGYDEYDVDAKLEYRLQPNIRLTLAHQTVMQDDIWRTHSTLYGDWWEGAEPGSDLERSADQERHLTYLQLHATDLDGFVDQVHFSVSDHIQNEDQVRQRKDSRRELSGTDVNTLGVWLQLNSETRIGDWVYGVSYYNDWVDSYGRKYKANGDLDKIELQGPVADDSTYSLIGAFAQDKVNLVGPLDFTVRGRYDHAQADAGCIYDPRDQTVSSLSKGWDAFVGSGRATLHLGEKKQWLFYAGASQGFRAPNLSDLSRLDSAGSGQIETPSTDVEPEYYLMYEAGVKARFDRVELEAAYFYTDIQGMIIRTPTGQTINGLAEVTKLNAGDGYIHGVEVQGKVRLVEDFYALGAFTWMEGEVTAFADGNLASKQVEPVSRLMPTTGMLALRWETAHRRYWAEASCTLAARQDQLSSGDLGDTQRIPPGGTPGYGVLALRAGWRPCKNFTLSAVLENLTDEDYRIHGSGVNEPGRNLILAGTLRF